jgi:hypothetical protein
MRCNVRSFGVCPADGRNPFPPRKKIASAYGVRLTAIGRATLIVLGFAVVAHACNVPVFRFALERWRPDPYRVTVLHRGALSDSDRALLAPWEEQQGKAQLNVTIRTVDVSELDEAEQELFAARVEESLPRFVVQYPAHLRIAQPVLSAPLSKVSIAALTDSPIRRELVKRLADGQTAVWLLLESGQSDMDDAAAKLIEEQIQQLAKELKLPELTDSSEDKLLSATPLQVAFSVIRIPRSEAEQPLIQMLLHSESDLLERNDPMVFPIFGRGRALLPLIGAGITPQNIHDSAAFLVGACSCEVKDQNPGFDLLLAADWDALLTQGGAPLLAAATRDPIPQGDPELIPIPIGSPIDEEFENVSHFTATASHDSWIVLGVMIAGVLVFVLWMARR